MIKPWPIISSTPQFECRVFSVRTDRACSPRTGMEHDFHLIDSPNWVNVIPLTPDNQVVLIRQYRFGSRSVTLEIPGGLVDPHEPAEEAARRELMEETGYGGGEIILLGQVNPNPALFGNACATYLAQGVTRLSGQRQDDGEDIEVFTRPLADIPALIRSGEIEHAMVLAAFSFYFVSPFGQILGGKV
ncbi:MAG: NUDIX hydrolase [Deltaproteobacteria bacterium]|nr:NUDIX hydrolase [Deltaproteobacteria bacterium]